MEFWRGFVGSREVDLCKWEWNKVTLRYLIVRKKRKAEGYVLKTNIWWCKWSGVCLLIDCLVQFWWTSRKNNLTKRREMWESVCSQVLFANWLFTYYTKQSYIIKTLVRYQIHSTTTTTTTTTRNKVLVHQNESSQLKFIKVDHHTSHILLVINVHNLYPLNFLLKYRTDLLLPCTACIWKKKLGINDCNNPYKKPYQIYYSEKS